MRFRVLLLILAISTIFNVSAKLKFKSFEATRSSCVIEMIETHPGKQISVDGAWIKNGGVIFPAISYECRLENGKPVYRATFPFQPELRNITIILEINRKRVKKNIQEDIVDYLNTNPYLRGKMEGL